MIRVQLERQGWDQVQIELVRDRLNPSWPLAMAKRQAVPVWRDGPIKAKPDL